MPHTRPDSEYQRRFAGLARLFGIAALERLRNAHVAVVGVGGVGSWTVEALARSGVGEITLIDLDDVCVTNINRQLPALTETVGRPKVEVLAERVLGIWPECRVHPVPAFLSPSNAAELLAPPFDFVVDAVDRTMIKALIISQTLKHGSRVLTVGGAGGKRDATQIRAADLALSEGDDLLKFVRRELRRRHGFPTGITPFGVSCVFSAERPVYPWADGSVRCEQDKDTNLKLDCASGFGTASFVTGAFGLAAAGEVVKHLVSPP